MQSDGNLVLSTTTNAPVWSSKTNGKGGTQLVLDGTGRLMIKNAANGIVWQSGAPVAGCTAN